MNRNRNIIILYLSLTVLASCGSSGPEVTTRVSAGQDTVIEWNGYALFAPADQLPDGLDVGIHTLPSEEIDADVLGPRNIAVSDGMVVSFENLPATRGLYRIDIPVSASDLEVVGVMIRTEGGLAKHAPDEPIWLPGFGTYDASTSVYSVTLAATAKSVSLLVYTRQRNPEELSEQSTPRWDWLASLDWLDHLPGIGTAYAQGITWPGDTIVYTKTPITQYGWAVRCDPTLINIQLCNKDSEELKQLVQWGVESAEILNGLGLQHLMMRTESPASLEITGDVVVYSDSPESTGDGSLYFPIVVVPSLPKGFLGIFQPAELVLEVIPDTNSATIIHELLHSVQYAEIFNLWDHAWVIEGTAAAVESLASGYRGQHGRAYRWGPWRDWAAELNADVPSKVYEYQASEFWLSVDPTLKAMASWYASAGAAGSSITTPGDYAAVDAALQSASGIELDDAFTELIRTRSSEVDSGYDHCEDIELTCDESSCPLSEERPFKFKPMSATCLWVVARIEDQDCDNPVFDLELEGDAQKHRFIVDETIVEAGKSVVVEEDFDLWVINLARDSGEDEPSEAVLKPRCPGPVSIISQNHDVSVRVSSCEPTSSPGVCQQHVKSQGLKYNSEVFEGKSRVTTSSRDAAGTTGQREVVDGKQPIREGETFSRKFDASVAGGSMAHASLSTTTTPSEDEFLVSGRFDLKAEHAQGGGWGGSAGGEVNFSIDLVIGAPSTVHIEGCEWFEISAPGMEAVKTGGHRCEYRTALDDRAFEILLEQDFSLIADFIEPQVLDQLNEVASQVKEYPRGDNIYLTLTSISFSSAESHTGDQSGEFKIRITWD